MQWRKLLYQVILKTTKGKPIIAASITVKDSYDGTVSDSSGNFHFTTTERGTHAFTITQIDFDDYEAPVDLNGQPLTLNISLKPKFNELKAVTVNRGCI
jgi:hypothetical protein